MTSYLGKTINIQQRKKHFRMLIINIEARLTLLLEKSYQLIYKLDFLKGNAFSMTTNRRRRDQVPINTIRTYLKNVAKGSGQSNKSA